MTKEKLTNFIFVVLIILHSITFLDELNCRLRGKCLTTVGNMYKSATASILINILILGTLIYLLFGRGDYKSITGVTTTVITYLYLICFLFLTFLFLFALIIQLAHGFGLAGFTSLIIFLLTLTLTILLLISAIERVK